MYYSAIPGSIRSRRRNGRIARAIVVVIILLVGVGYIALDNEEIRKIVVTRLNNWYDDKSDGDDKGNKDDKGESEEDDGKYKGRYPNSLITLFYPYTLLSDIVLAQPIPPTDIPFLWHIHRSDERIIKRILTSCFGLELVELNDLPSIERAMETNLVSTLHRDRHVITSPFIREVSEIFSVEHFARMICFFRHPLDYDLHPALPKFSQDNDWLTRFLSDWHDGEITFKELGVAKHVVRECCLVGTIDKMRGSVLRIKEHFGWEYAGGMGDFGGEKCIDDSLEDDPLVETYIDHESEEWYRHYEKNRFDCELYEISQSAWRAQIQTIVPFPIQLSRQAKLDKEQEEKDAKDAAKKAKEKKKKEEGAQTKKRKKFWIF